ncbi:MAG: hypothetical protein ACXABD_03760 [Candidatus Thorarchaeota archaeon]
MKAINGSHSFTTLLQGSPDDITTGHFHRMLESNDYNGSIVPFERQSA